MKMKEQALYSVYVLKYAINSVCLIVQLITLLSMLSVIISCLVHLQINAVTL